MSQSRPRQCMNSVDVIVAAAINRELTIDATHAAKEWQSATPVTFCANWEGENADPERQTAVRALWSPETLYLRYECRYRELNVFSDSDPKRSKRSSVGSRCRGTISATRSIEAALLQGIRSIAEWILDRSRHLAQTTTRPDEWSPALDVAQPRRACLEGRISYSDESASRSFRSQSRVAC
jgi:hypothetical protein